MYTEDQPSAERVTTRDHQALDVEPERDEAPLARAADVRPAVRRVDDPPVGVPLENVRVIVRHSHEVDQLFAALAEAQAMDGYGDVEKSKTARVKGKSRSGADVEYTYDYETLRDVIDAVRPYLARVGVATMQFPFPGERSVLIRTMLTHKSGQWLYNDLSALIPMPDPQAVGSGISYLRRYALKAIACVAAEDEDDDGAGASRRPATPPQASVRRSQQAQAPPRETEKRPEPPRNVGAIAAVAEKAGALLVKLSTGFEFAVTKADGELQQAIRRHEKAGTTIEASCRASSDPARFAPVLVEVVEQRRAQ